MKSFELDWGIFALAELLVSYKADIGTKFKTCLDIGSGAGIQTEIMRHAGLNVFQVDKYQKNADYQVDFLNYEFKHKFDIIYCSHVIEHQRNVGIFLDKIFDVLSDDGLLVISAPKHPATTLIEGHLNCFFTSYFVQHLIHAGFNLKLGQYLSCGGIENAAIVSKDPLYNLKERLEDGYVWTEAQQRRCMLELSNQHVESDICYFYNCKFFHSSDGKSIKYAFPHNYHQYGLKIDASRWGINLVL